MIAVLCATPREMAGLLPLLEENEDRQSPGGMRLSAGRTGAGDVLALCTGIGKAAAAAGTRFIMDHYPVEALVIWGTAGALSPRLRLGDLVISDQLVPADVGVAHSEAFKPTGPGICEEGRLIFHPSFPASASLRERACAAAEDAELPYHLGTVLTCDQIILDPDLREHLGSSFSALAVEMEGAAAAQVAAADDLPFIAVRAVSDELTHDFVGLEKVLEYRGQTRRNLWRKRFRLTVADPSALAGIREFMRGTDAALRNGAAFLEKFLAAPGLSRR